MSYSFDYLGVIIEVFSFFKSIPNFYSSEININSEKKTFKLNPRTDNFFIDHHLTDMQSLGPKIFERINQWQKQFSEMGLDKCKHIMIIN